MHQTIAFRCNALIFLDSESLYINLDFDTSATQIQSQLLEIYQVKDRISFLREADFGDQFWMINFTEVRCRAYSSM